MKNVWDPWPHLLFFAQQTELSDLVASGNDFELEARSVRDLMDLTMRRAASEEEAITSQPWREMAAAGEEREAVQSSQPSEIYPMSNVLHPQPPEGQSLNDIKIMVSGPEMQPASS